MRIRHGLRLDEPDDFDIATQDAILALWDQISQATFLALIVISSIALMVGGIGVMAIMSISVTERTREIGVRKALGATPASIIGMIMTEAVLITSVSGYLGLVAGVGLVELVARFAPDIPFLRAPDVDLGIAISATALIVGAGALAGFFPAWRAARVNPITALRDE